MGTPTGGAGSEAQLTGGELEYRLRRGERVYVLRRGETVIGREPSCDIQLDGDLVSRRHARLLVEPVRLVLEDLGSSNGSRVNDTCLEGPYELRAGDRVRIGLSVLEVEATLRHRYAAPTLRLIHCDACGAVLAHEMRFCVQCGHQLRSTGDIPLCASCNEPLRAGAEACSACGAPVELEPDTEAAAPETTCE